MEWISVKDRLPEHEQEVDIWHGNKRYTDCMYCDYEDGTEKHFFYESHDLIIPISHVTHWMPLPEPPNN